VESLSGDADVGAVTRGVAGGTVAGMGTEQSKTGTSGFWGAKPELPVYKPGTSGFWAKQNHFWSAQNSNFHITT
jgi:hypothetical protein